MEGFSKNPMAVYALGAVALYLTALGYVYHARGRVAATLIVVAISYLAMAVVVRQALRS